MVRQVVELCNHGPSQTVAEALLYDCLRSELTTGSADATLARLKGLLAMDYPRGSWDFSVMFDRVLPKVASARHALYRALGAAILDADRVDELDAFDVWRSTVATDPFAGSAPK